MIVIGTTTAAHRVDGQDPRTYASWLMKADTLRASLPDTEIRFFAALELDARGLAPFEPLIARMRASGGRRWLFGLDDDAEVITTQNRLRRICIGNNLVSEYAMEAGASHCLYLAADVSPHDRILPRLLELDAPLAASHIRTYCLGEDCPPLPEFAPWDVRSQETETCAAMMLRRDVLTRIKWRVDIDRGLTDDPAMCADVRELLGHRVLSRHDCVSVHYPESIEAFEHRATEEQRRVHRG
jgi:hypothetical protein